jgi:hypothetical protein
MLSQQQQQQTSFMHPLFRTMLPSFSSSEPHQSQDARDPNDYDGDHESQLFAVL